MEACVCVYRYRLSNKRLIKRWNNGKRQYNKPLERKDAIKLRSNEVSFCTDRSERKRIASVLTRSHNNVYCTSEQWSRRFTAGTVLQPQTNYVQTL